MQVVKLSDTVQTLPRQVTCNVHGVAQCFLDVGTASAASAAGDTAASLLSHVTALYILHDLHSMHNQPDRSQQPSAPQAVLLHGQLWWQHMQFKLGQSCTHHLFKVLDRDRVLGPW